MSSTNPSTPLRYPGGKQILAPFVGDLLSVNGMQGCTYAEPYAGGAGVALSLLLAGRVSCVLLNDKCHLLTTFWKQMLHHTEIFIQCIEQIPITMETWKQCKLIIQNEEQFTPMEVAVAFFFLNRTNFSGVIHGGVIGGMNQTGNYKIDARFPKERLIALIRRIAEYRSSIHIFNKDALAFLDEDVRPLGDSAFVYCDPPYYVKGQALYMNAYAYADHAAVAEKMASLGNVRWMVSYDNVQEIAELYRDFNLFTFDLQYSAKSVRKEKELLVIPHSIQLPETSVFPVLSNQNPKALRKA